MLRSVAHITCADYFGGLDSSVSFEVLGMFDIFWNDQMFEMIEALVMKVLSVRNV